MTRHITNDLEYLKHAISRLKTSLSVSKLLDLGVPELDDLTLSCENIRTAKSHSKDEYKEEIASFNPIRPTDDLLEGTVVKDLKQEDVETSSESVLLSLFDSTIRKDKSYDISVSGRKSSAKTSSSMAAVIFNGGYMMFADSNNKVVNIISDEFEVLTYISLKNKPTDLSLEDKLVMVAGGYSVLFYTVCCSCLEIKKVREFKTKENPWSVTLIGNEIAILIPEADGGNTDAYIQVRSAENRILDNVNILLIQRIEKHV